MGRLVGEAAEADAEFWEQSAFQEDDTDEEFDEAERDGSGSETSSTATDSDIDAPEPEDDGDAAMADGGDDAPRRRGAGAAVAFVDDSHATKKKAAYVDPALAASRGWGGSLGAAAAAAAAAAARALASDGSASGHKRPRESSGRADDLPAASPRERLALRSGVSSHASEGVSAVPPPPPPPSQEEVLIDAAHTTIESLRVLAGAARADAERVARNSASLAAGFGRGHALPATVPLVRFHSRRGAPDTLTFTLVDTTPTMGVPVPRGQGSAAPRPRCVISGKPALYMDPITGSPYADAKAFKILRERAAKAASAELA